MREGQPVTKSRLVVNQDAARIGQYLRGRAMNRGRTALMRELGMESVSETTLIGIEWNALTYAGHTVWGVHAERVGGAYVGGAKRRPIGCTRRAPWTSCAPC